MIKRFITIALTTFACTLACADTWDHSANVRDGVIAFQEDYAAGGMGLVTATVAKCYSLGEALPRNTDVRLRRMEFCASIDMAGYQVDSYFSRSKGFPPTPYFTNDRLVERFSAFDDWFQGADKERVFNGLMARVRENLTQASKTSKDQSTATFAGKFTGRGEGTLTATIKATSPSAYSVELATSAKTAGGGGCGGSILGTGVASGSTMIVTSEKSGERCELSLTFSNGGKQIQVDEVRGCSFFHGASCSFDGTLTKK